MAESNCATEIVEVCRVAPPAAGLADYSATSAPEFLPLTFFDIRWLRLLHIQRLYFYEISNPNASTAAFFHSNILPRLKHSLSLALQHFLPLTGTLTWPPNSPKPILSCAPGDGVSLTVAQSNADFYHLSGTDNAICVATACHPLVPDLSASLKQAAVLAIQLTVFPNCGLSIGFSMNHAVLDGKSLVSFVKSWAYMCRSIEGNHHDEHHQSPSCFLPPELRPSYDRTLIKDPAKLVEIFSNQWQNLDGPDNRSLLPWKRELPPDSYRGTFQLPRAKLKKLRQLVIRNKNVQQDHPEHQYPIHISEFALTCAYTWVCLVKAEGRTSDKKTILDIPVDCRSRLEPPLPETYFGNCVGTMYVVLERESLLGKDGVSAAVKAISEAIKGLENGILNGAENWVSFLAGCTDGQTYYIVSSHRFEFYNIDFGWGRPRKVDVVSKYITGVVSLSDSSNGEGGVEFGLVLKRHDMEAFASSFVEGLESL